MENENEQKVDEELDEINEDSEDTDWKSLALKNQGIAKRNKTKLDKLQKDFEELKASAPKEQKPKQEPEKPEKSNDVDYDNGDKALLRSFGINGVDERAMARNWIQRTNDDIEKMANDEIFIARLKAFRDQKAAKEAVPIDPRHAATPSKSKAEFWDDKPFEEVPPELKTEVLNRRLAKEKEGDKFSPNPVILGH